MARKGNGHPGEPVTLRLFCAYCGGALDVQFEEWRLPHEDTSDAPGPDEAAAFDLAVLHREAGPFPRPQQSYACLYCGKENRATFPTKIAWVAKTNDSEARH